MLHEPMWELFSDAPAPEDLVVALQHVLPKGQVAGEVTEVEREAGTTRPEGLLHTDAKLVQASVAYGGASTLRATQGASRAASSGAGSSQRMSWIWTCGCALRGYPVASTRSPGRPHSTSLPLSPSADHALHFEAMERCGILEGVVSFVRSRYAASKLLVVGASGMEPFTEPTCGVLQGDHLSVLLLVLNMDWILEQLSRALDPVGGLFRACTDDIGIMLNALERLLLIAPAFRASEEAPGIALHPGNGVIVPMADAGGERMLRRAHRRLARAVPQLASFRVADAGRYLEFEIDRGGGQMWRERKRSGFGARNPEGRWNNPFELQRRVVTAVEGERRELNRRTCWGTASRAVPSVFVCVCVAGSESGLGAQSVFPDIAAQARALEAAAEEFGVVVGVASHSPCPQGWDREAMEAVAARNASEAHRPSCRVADAGGRQARVATRRGSGGRPRSCSRTGCLRRRRNAWPDGGQLLRG